MPITSAMTIAIDASSIVTGSFSAISAVTGFCMRSDSPRSPCSTPPSQYSVAHRQRLVEMHLRAQVRDDVRIALLAGEHHRRIAGQQLLQPEDQHRHEQQRRDDRREAPDEEVQHGRARQSAIGEAIGCTSARLGALPIADRLSPSLLEPQALHAHQAVGHGAQPGQLARVRPQPVAVIQVDDRPVLQRDARRPARRA